MIEYFLIFGFIHNLVATSTKTHYLWKESIEWMPCSVTCGKGIRIKEIFCAVHTNGTFTEVAKHNCHLMSEPKVNIISCHPRKCPNKYEWKTNRWSLCSHICGHLGFKTRDVDCIDANEDSSEAVVEEALCDSQRKPLTRSICNRIDCKPSFTAGKWGKCVVSETCQLGKQKRNLKCTKHLSDGSLINVPITHCYKRGLSPPQKLRQCLHHKVNDHCKKIAPPRKVKFSVINTNIYQMRRSEMVKLAIGQVGYLLPYSRVIVECQIEDFPLREIKWSHQNTTVQYEKKKSNDRIRVDKNGKLRIKSLVFKDQGEWRCRADKSFKSVIIKIRSPSSGFRDWAVRSNLWKRGMLSEESAGLKNSEEVIHWVKSDWSVCSVTCSGDGSQYRELQCEKLKHNTYEVLDDVHCERTLKSYPSRIRVCHNSVKCPEWHFNMSKESKCLKECIDIGSGTLDIDLKCVYMQQQVPLHMCDWDQRPLLGCRNDICQLDWRLSAWSKCSKSCGGVGFQARYITCVWKHSRKSARSLCYDRKLPTPVVVRKCSSKPCKIGCVDLSSLCPGNSRSCYHGLYRHLCCLTCQNYFKKLS